MHLLSLDFSVIRKAYLFTEYYIYEEESPQLERSVLDAYYWSSPDHAPCVNQNNGLAIAFRLLAMACRLPQV